MFSMKNAALVGLAAADRTLFAPVASPYGQVETAYAPTVAGAYGMSADAMVPVQPMEFVQPEPQGSDQTWLFAGVGALALVGAYAARSGSPSAVATLDDEDLESATIATLGVGGAAPKKKEEGGGLLAFLMSGRKAFNDGTFGELELLSGATRRPSDDPASLANRFKIKYDTRSRKVEKAKAQPKARPITTWRSKTPDSSLYK
jgi:hypothetical protein